MHISGKFDVTMQALDGHATGQDGIALGRMSIAKTFEGELAATSSGEMLSARSPEKSSAGYVAIEQVVGTLDGKSGSFVLQHFGMMARGEHRLILEIVPDSGTGELTGLSGTMTIDIKDGVHHYGMDYELPG